MTNTLVIGLRSMCSSNTGRAENQDNYLCVHQQQAQFLQNQQPQQRAVNWPLQHWRLAVIDGMGGPGNGRQIAESLSRKLLDMPPANSADALNRQLDAIHQQLYQEWGGHKLQPGATLTLLESGGENQAALYHVGDSRLYAVTDTEVKCLTIDHVPATQALLQGVINLQDWELQVHQQNRSTIAQAMGLGNNLNPKCPWHHTDPELYPYANQATGKHSGRQCHRHRLQPDLKFTSQAREACSWVVVHSEYSHG